MRVDMVPGTSYDLVSSKEMHGHMAAISNKMQEFVRAELQGIKPIRFFAQQNVAANAGFVLSARLAPQSGYVWAVTRANLVNSESANGVSLAALYRCQDVSDLIVPTVAAPISVQNQRFFIDTLNYANGASARFSTTQAIFQAGEYPIAAGVNSDGVNAITVAFVGEAIEVPAEMVGKFLQ